MAKKHHSNRYDISHVRVSHIPYASPRLYNLKNNIRSIPVSTYNPPVRRYGRVALRSVQARATPLPQPQQRFIDRNRPSIIHAAELHRAVICARRKIRKEVLHATGRANGRHRYPKRNVNSQVRC